MEGLNRKQEDDYPMEGCMFWELGTLVCISNRWIVIFRAIAENDLLQASIIPERVSKTSKIYSGLSIASENRCNAISRSGPR
jgi:predicted secreted Zn-dependent protease